MLKIQMFQTVLSIFKLGFVPKGLSEGALRAFGGICLEFRYSDFGFPLV